jgi:hypothetical protein
MWTELQNFLGAERYSQHALCLTNDPVMIFLYVLSDLTTFSAYFVIGLILLITTGVPVARVRPSMRLLYGAFIFLCGLSHLTMVLTLFSGVYRLDIIVRAAMGAVSAVTAIAVVADYAWAARRTG